MHAHRHTHTHTYTHTHTHTHITQYITQHSAHELGHNVTLPQPSSAVSGRCRHGVGRGEGRRRRWWRQGGRGKGGVGAEICGPALAFLFLVCMYVCTYVSTYVCGVCTCVCTYVCTYVCGVCTYVCIPHIYTCTYEHQHLWVYV